MVDFFPGGVSQAKRDNTAGVRSSDQVYSHIRSHGAKTKNTNKKLSKAKEKELTTGQVVGHATPTSPYEFIVTVVVVYLGI